MRYQSLVQYSRVVDNLKFPTNVKNPILFVYFSENSTFVEDYEYLNLRRVDFRHVFVPRTKVPYTMLNATLKEWYKKLKLIPLSDNMVLPSGRNIIVDLTVYTDAIDALYKPVTYRQRSGMLIQLLLNHIASFFPAEYQKILVYSVNRNKPANKFFDRRVYPILRQLKEETFPFDDLLLTVIDQGQPRYRLLVKDREYKFPRVLQFLRKIKTFDEEEEEKEHEKTAKRIVSSIEPEKLTGDEESKKVVKYALKKFLEVKPDKIEIDLDTESPEDAKRMMVASVLFSVNGDLRRSVEMAKSVPKKQMDKVLKAVILKYKDDVLVREKSESQSIDPLVNAQRIEERVDHKTPEHIFSKRQIDFEVNLKKDMTNAFSVLEKRDIPLKLKSLKIVPKPSDPADIEGSDEATIHITMVNPKGKELEVNLNIPLIDRNTGTFRVNGQRKCLINQIVSNPISFPKPYHARFSSSYSTFRIYSKHTKRMKYLECFMGGFKLPLMILMAYAWGFKNVLRQFDLDYEIVEKKPKAGFFTKVPSSYLVFKNVDSELQEQMVVSFINAKVDKYDIDLEKSPFLSDKYFNDLIIMMTGRVDATYLITNNVENIVDPVARQVLINQQLPFELSQILKYMASRCVEGYYLERNHLGNKRIRNSELMVHLAQKQLLKAYTEYREQYLAGNEDATLNIPENSITKKFLNLEIVQNMEYANPIEEMATITKISPVGKDVGGIHTKDAVQLDERNVHPSYFGNIDPLDTAEGGNIGITQQLTVDAMITSSRGMFGIKPESDEERAGILSVSATMVPFIENNEGARIIMSCNQSKQMLPLKNPEPPIVQTGYESMLSKFLSDNFVKRSPCNGIVKHVSDAFIEIDCNGKKTHTISLRPVQLKAGSGKDTLSVFTPVVRKGQKVKENQIIAEGAAVSGGTISLGRNLAVAYMPYKGYNFEDGLVINERLIHDDTLTSLHGVTVEADVAHNDKVLYIAKIGEMTTKGEILFRKIPGELSELMDIDETDEGLDTYEGQILYKSPGGRIADIEVYANVDAEKFPLLKDLIERTRRRHKVPAGRKYKVRGTVIPGIRIIFHIEQELKIGFGDKLCNRYGNKGIISLIEPNEKMPRTPWGDTVDIIMNPLGVLNRMNLGQLYETYCGLISKFAARQIINGMKKPKIIEMLGTIVTTLDTTPNKKFGKSFVASLRAMKASEFDNMIQQIRTRGFVPIIIPPFRAPSQKQIAELMKKFKLKPSYRLYLPEYGVWTTNPVPVGYTYVAKLEHLSELKLNARSTGPMTGKYGQPTAGKRQEGGQRMGEGDTWSLISYNCLTLLSEFFGPLSDDIVTKNEMITEIIQKGATNFKPPKTSQTREMLESYMIGMMVQGR